MNTALLILIAIVVLSLFAPAGNAKKPPQEGPSFRIRDLQSRTTKTVIFRTDREEEWLKHNPLLLHREFGYVIDTDEVVVGNGHSRFADLPRLSPGLAGVVMFSVEGKK